MALSLPFPSLMLKLPNSLMRGTPRWLTKDILNLSKRDTSFEKPRACNTADAWKRYRGARNQATNMITKAKQNYIKVTFQNGEGNSMKLI